MLKVWIPGTTDTRDQGLGGTEWINDNVTVVNDGKLGKCLSFNGSNSRLSTTGFELSNKWSFAVWIKDIGNLNRWQLILMLNTNGSDADAQMSFWIHDNYQADSGISRFEICANGRWYSSVQYVPGQWNHFAGTYDESKLRFYLNGEKIFELSNTNAKLERHNLTIGAKSTSSDGGHVGYSNAYNGLMNDLRIYDNEVLSPKKVKEISKGLILHYPLADTYIEPTTNLISTEDGLSQTCYNASISKYGYGTNTDMYKTVTTYDGRKGTKVYMGTNGNRCYPYVYVDNMFVSDGTNSPAYKTLSFDYYGTIGDFLGPYKLGNGSGTATYTVTCQGIKTTGTYSDMGSFAVTPNKWNHVEITFHGTTEADSQWGYIRVAGTHTSDTSNFWFFANMQLETNDHATGYAGPNGVRNEDTVYDVSGYGHNGTASGITYSSDTARYNGSYVLNGTNTCYINSASLPSETQSVSFWIKTGTVTGNSVVFADYGSKIAFGFNGNNTTYIVCDLVSSSSNYSTGTKCVADDNWKSDDWNHIVVIKLTSSPSYTFKTYLNGALLKNSSTNYWIHTTDNLIIGRRSTGSPFNGQISDFRAYATQLSDDDVLALYNTPITLSNNGVLLVQGEYVEG